MQLQSALEHYRRQRRIATLGLIGARREAQRGNLARSLALVTLAQQQAAADAITASQNMLDEQGVHAPAVAAVDISALAGIASDGRDLMSLLKVTTHPDAPTGSFDRAVLTQISDAGRAAGAASIATRPKVAGYVRMLVPPSCSRCAILAGRVYRYNAGFSRHPRCDCRAIPCTERTAQHLTTDPRAYFDSLDEVQQARVFTNAGAQAIRDGADIGQVVNARRGMTTAQVGTQSALITKSGATRRRIRLMPETIMQIAGNDRREAIRLLRIHGYLHD